MTCPPVTVVVVSRHRPQALRRCLTGLSQLFHPRFEIVVVADPAGIATAQDWAQGRPVKLVPFDAANISAARNLGIAEAAGEIVAFIDDDAVPEPTWLGFLTDPFADPAVSAAGGFVLGRNGISFQWRARIAAPDGSARPIEVPGPDHVAPPPGHAVKTEGTNMAFRRSVLAELGGFDPAFRFYLDETDLNMRLARAGHVTAIVPDALVHHGYAASDRRDNDRVPTDLTEIGASQAAFLLRHAPTEDHDRILAAFARDQQQRLFLLLRRRKLRIGAVEALMAGLRSGVNEGRERHPAPLPRITTATSGFQPFPNAPDGPVTVLSGSLLRSRALRAEARSRTKVGERVTLFLFSRTALYHRMHFRDDGYWEQTGGVWGSSLRDQRIFRLMRLATRVAEERQRLAKLRRFSR